MTPRSMATACRPNITCSSRITISACSPTAAPRRTTSSAVRREFESGRGEDGGDYFDDEFDRGQRRGHRAAATSRRCRASKPPAKRRASAATETADIRRRSLRSGRQSLHSPGPRQAAPRVAATARMRTTMPVTGSIRQCSRAPSAATAQATRGRSRSGRSPRGRARAAPPFAQAAQRPRASNERRGTRSGRLTVRSHFITAI